MSSRIIYIQRRSPARKRPCLWCRVNTAALKFFSDNFFSRAILHQERRFTQDSPFSPKGVKICPDRKNCCHGDRFGADLWFRWRWHEGSALSRFQFQCASHRYAVKGQPKCYNFRMTDFARNTGTFARLLIWPVLDSCGIRMWWSELGFLDKTRNAHLHLFLMSIVRRESHMIRNPFPAN